MSIMDNNTISVSKKLTIRIGYFFLIVFLIILFWIFRNIQVEKMISTQQQQISETIIKTVNEQAKLDLMMPDIVFINLDSAHKMQLNDTISKQIAVVLSEKYLNIQKVNPSEINFQPYFVFPDTADSKRNYTLTKPQLEELKNHIQFLTSQVDKAVAATKEEVGKDIDRLNTWVSIWIGVIGFLGIFIPIVINGRSSAELKEINKKAEQAEAKVTAVQQYITDNKNHIEDLKTLPPELKDLKTKFDALIGNVNKAKIDSGKAIEYAETAVAKADKLEGIVVALNDISKIKDIDGSFLLYNKKPFESLKILLTDIHTSLNNNQELHNNAMVNDVFRQLAKNIRLIALYDFIKPANFDLLNQFALALSNIITQPMTQDSYIQALALLNTLNTNLTND